MTDRGGGRFIAAGIGAFALVAAVLAAWAPVSAAPQDNITFHQNAARTGWYPDETVLTVANVPQLKRIATLKGPTADAYYGKVYAQPLYVAGEEAGGKQRNLVIIAGSAGQLFAYDAVTLALVWHHNFTNPAAKLYQQTWADTGCADVNDDLGIISTPVIDRALHRLYVVVATSDQSVKPFKYYLRIHAISLADGKDVAGVGPTSVSATSGSFAVSPLWNFSRSALLESKGNVYVALASHCDNAPNLTHGWILSYSATTLKPTGALPGALNATNVATSDNYYLGSPWMGGFGPAADSAGNIYFATGNGPWNGAGNYSMTVMKVPGDLDASKIDYFTPATWQDDSGADLDLGSGGAMVVPDEPTWTYPRLLIQGGKQSTKQNGEQKAWKYILDRDNMGKLNGARAAQNVAGPIYGGPAYFRDATRPYVVYGGGKGTFKTPLTTYVLQPTPMLERKSVATYPYPLPEGTPSPCLECRTAGSQPVVTSNGTKAGTAVVWVLKTPGDPGGKIYLLAFNALEMGKPLFGAYVGDWMPGKIKGSNNKPPSYIGGALISPLIAAGRVYVPYEGAVAVYGLSAPALPFAAASPPSPHRPAALEAESRAAIQPNVLYGTIAAVNGTKLTLRLRNGSSVAVDATRAITSGHYSAPLFVGKLVVAEGVRRADGTLDAARVERIGNLDPALIDR